MGGGHIKAFYQHSLQKTEDHLAIATLDISTQCAIQLNRDVNQAQIFLFMKIEFKRGEILVNKKKLPEAIGK